MVPGTYRGKTTGKSSFRQIIEYTYFERRIYLSLYEYLEKQNALGLIFDPPSGIFESTRERVFWRVGISVPKAVRTVSFKDRLLLSLKRRASQCLMIFSSAHIEVAIDPDTGLIL